MTDAELDRLIDALLRWFNSRERIKQDAEVKRKERRLKRLKQKE